MPTAATSIPSASQVWCPAAAAVMTIDLLTKPLNNGNAEMEAAPTQQKMQVRGIERNSPPSSVALDLPVRCMIAPIDISSRALKRMSA